MKRELHVAKGGNDGNSGGENSPFLTVSRAAAVAQPGDMVIVHEGTYREWVSPTYGGTDTYNRITYAAAPGEHVVIKGSEEIRTWNRVEGSVWKCEIPDTFFGGWNPYREMLFGDWFIDQGRVHHLGEVFLNGVSLFEMESLEKVKHPTVWERALDRDASLFTWYCEQHGSSIVMYANFHEYDPNEELVEISVRPTCFYPRNTGVDYITVRGVVYPVVDGKFNVLLSVDTAGEGWNNFTISVTDDAGNTAVKNINVQYIREEVKIDDDETEDNLWWYYGILLIIAAVVIMLTIFVFAKRGEE